MLPLRLSFVPLLHLALTFAGRARSETVSTTTHYAFDYVIIGGGTAGLVVAARLSEDPNVTVAVIEAGIHHVDEPLVDTPGLFGQSLGNPAFDWGFHSIPQAGLNGTVIPVSRGKLLGGSSGVNYLAWDRASAKEYDSWHTLGATGWNWTTLLPYFKKSESALLPPNDGFPGDGRANQSNFDAVHGTSGPIQASFSPMFSNITLPFVKTVEALGFQFNADPYSGNATGLYNSQSAVDRVKNLGKRSYSANTYYSASKDRPNLKVFLSTQATLINFAPGHGALHASSVNVVAVGDGGVSGVLSARKDVVLAAGPIQTPQLLELSGIGDKSILKGVGIKTLVDLPGVGENLQEHPLGAQDFELSGDFSTFDLLRNDPAFLAAQQAEYATNHTGVFTDAISVLAFVPIHAATSAPTISAIHESALQLLHSPHVSALSRAQYAIQTAWIRDEDVAHFEFIMWPGGGLTALAPSPNASYITLDVGVMHPFSRGFVHINSSDPLAAPLVNPNYLDEEVDFQSFLEGMKFIRKISQSAPLSNSIAKPHDPPANATSDADLVKYIKANLEPLNHHAGTAPMVPRELGGVVDPKTLAVYGTSNLRVVDASLIPLQVATHTQATVYAIAERAADILKLEAC
ncbi:alcohol oxidase [Trametes maxima]|nr:alcohol oxidase [Trametes maxima]